MRERYPAARLVILADLGNGQKDAEDAARSVGGLVAVPDFGPNRPDDATDFNDLVALRGLEAVRRCIEAARAEAEAVTPETDVTDVTDVQPSNDGDFTVTTGVVDAGIKVGRKDEPSSLTQQWVCSPLHIEVVTFDGQENNFGRLRRT